jgi:hypothetical protein
MIRAIAVIGLVVIPAVVAGQNRSYPPAPRQISLAVSALPENLQGGAKVLGYDANGKLTTLRRGTNDFVCIADDQIAKMFHVACYHNSLEPFMARGRELHALKKSREAVDSVRLADVKSGRYSMPTRPAALYQYYAERDSVNVTSGAVKSAEYLYVVYTPYASQKTTGITEHPIDGGPWIMYPGKPWAHIMIAPQKPANVNAK